MNHPGTAAALQRWLEAGAPLDRPPSFPDDPSPEELGVIYERHLLTARREKGAYYTPPLLVRILVAATLDPLLAEGADPFALPAVLDLSCGAGAFLLAAAERIASHLQHEAARTGQPPPQPARWLGRLHGIDTDPDAVAVARLALCKKTAAPFSAATGLRCADALTDPGLAPGSIDVVLGNPPFLGEEDHGHRFRALRQTPLGPRLEARGDYAYLFVHLALDLLREGGVLGLVLPESLTAAAGATGLRRRLVAEARIQSIVVLPEQTNPGFFEAPGQRNCLLLLRKGPAPDHRPRVETLFLGAPCLSHLAPEQRALLDAAGRFRLSAPDDDDLCALMEAAGAPLSASFEITTGVQAGPARVSAKAVRRLGAAPVGLPAADDSTPLPGQGVFVLTPAEVEALCLSDAERAFLRPFYFAHELRPFKPLPPARHHLLYLTPATCPDLSPYPALTRHFDRFQRLTSRRRETRLGYRTPFQLHWPREEARFLSPKLFSVRQTPRPCFVFSAGPAFVDLAVNVISPARNPSHPAFSLPALCALLNASAIHHYLRHRGKNKGPILQIDGAPLSCLPIPPWRPDLDHALCALADRLAAGRPDRSDDRRQLDLLAATAYYLPRVP